MNTLETVEPETCGLNSESTLQLPYGLLGFERVKNYHLLTNPHEQPFMWLQMADDAKQAFLVISPFLVLPDYQPDISAEDVEFLGLTDPADALLLNIVTLKGKNQATINLKGPIVVNRHTLVAKQVIPNNVAKFDLKHPLPIG